MADGLRTRQIIRNLLTNATRYGGTNVKVEIDVHEDTGRLTVMDDGNGVLGIDEDKNLRSLLPGSLPTSPSRIRSVSGWPWPVSWPG